MIRMKEKLVHKNTSKKGFQESFERAIKLALSFPTDKEKEK